MKLINTEKAPGAIGPYSQGIKIGNVVYCSGQIPVDPATGTVAGTAIEEIQPGRKMQSGCHVRYYV